jgi:DNA-binding transcriptional regulator YhcF (GntR family)
MSGYVCLHRKIMDNPIWKQLPESRAKVFLTILMRANYRTSKIWDHERNSEVEILPGTMVTSLEDLADKSGCSMKKVRLSLEYLEMSGMISVKKGKHGTLVTVINWDAYQPQGQTEGTQGADEGHDEGTKRALSEEVKKGIKKHTPDSGLLFPDDSDSEPEVPVSKKTVTRGAKKFSAPVLKLAAHLLSVHPTHMLSTEGATRDELKKVFDAVDESKWGALERHIRADHAADLASEKWAKDNGKYVMRLGKWIDTGKHRWIRMIADPQSAQQHSDEPEMICVIDTRLAKILQRPEWKKLKRPLPAGVIEVPYNAVRQ